MEFAVQPEGEDQGLWVLAVDPIGERLLVTNPADKSLRWVGIAQCKFLKGRDPEAPTSVIVVQPKSNSIAVPGLSNGRNCQNYGGCP